MSDLSHLPLSALTLPVEDRPRMPPISGADPLARRKGGQLALIHRHYLQELARVDAVLRRIEARDAPPEELMSIILSTDLRKNLHAAGTICGHQCQVLSMHHNIEEYSMFPALEQAGNAALVAVVAQLRREHKVVHELLMRLEQEARDLVADPVQERFDRAFAIFRRLAEVVTSHFGYEEKELAEAIGEYLDGI
ncbi:MAG: hemerythrin domain-containing protein [Arenibacterium sp.]